MLNYIQIKILIYVTQHASLLFYTGAQSVHEPDQWQWQGDHFINNLSFGCIIIVKGTKNNKNSTFWNVLIWSNFFWHLFDSVQYYALNFNLHIFTFHKIPIRKLEVSR